MATIWIDLDNTPHVPFFRPLIRELESRGHQVQLTARDAFQVWELVQQMGLRCRKVGRHSGKNPVLKIAGLAIRSVQLAAVMRRNRPNLALSHGSRSQLVAAKLLGIPTVAVDDYEHSRPAPFMRLDWILIPESIPKVAFARFATQVRHYSGIKEDVYVADFKPDPSILKTLRLQSDEIIVTVRPPATEAHYHNSESEMLFNDFMERLCATPATKAVLLPRNEQQKIQLQRTQPSWFESQKVTIPECAVNGLNLVWHSDLVVSGGGTMNREAAALGVPVYSIFRGKIGAVDQQLQKEGRLVLIETRDDVQKKIALERRPKAGMPDMKSRKAAQQIIDHVEGILRETGALAA